MTAEWEEGRLDGHRSLTQASSVLLFILVGVESKGKRTEREEAFPTLSKPLA